MKIIPYLFGIDHVVVIAIWIVLSCIYAYTYVGNPSGTYEFCESFQISRKIKNKHAHLEYRYWTTRVARI